MINFVEKLSPLALLALNFGLVVVLGFIDYITGEELSFFIFYLLPIIVVSWYAGKRIGTSFALLCLGIWFLAKFYNNFFYSSLFIFVSNTTMRLVIFLAVVNLIVMLKSRSERINELEIKRQNQKAVINTTQEMVAVLSEYITLNNSEIINWVNKKRENGHQVPKQVEDASRAIGESLEALTKICFTKDDNNGAESEYQKYFDKIRKGMDKKIIF